MPKHKQALDELKSLGSVAVPTLLEELAVPRADAETTASYVQDGLANDIAEALGAIGDARAIGPPVAAGKDNIVSAPRALAAFPDGIDALVSGVDDPDAAIRANSIRGLAFATRDQDRVVGAITKPESTVLRRGSVRWCLLSDLLSRAFPGCVGSRGPASGGHLDGAG
jgi:hypothetical protein